MRRVKAERHLMTVELSASELGILNNALNEVCNGIDLPEFDTRMGAQKRDVLKLLNEVRTARDLVAG
jgi:hypothetical protein